jgi:hypothetical protein
MATRINETMEFICNCLVFNDEYIDKLFTEFDVDMDESEVYEILDTCHDQQNYKLFGNLIIRRIFMNIENEYVEKGLKEDLFTWSINNQGSELCYAGKEIKHKSQLEAIIREKKEAEQWLAQKNAPREFLLTDKDKKILLGAGYLNKDMELIEIEANVCQYTRHKKGLDYEIERDEAIEALGRENWLYGIGRTAFHWDTIRDCKRGKDTISFESGIVGRRVNKYEY